MPKCDWCGEEFDKEDADAFFQLKRIFYPTQTSENAHVFLVQCKQ